MALSLHQAFVPNCQQTLDALSGLIDKGEAHVKEHGLTDADLIEAQLAGDMWPLPWHVRSCWVHSAYAVEQLQTGTFTPNFSDVPETWDAMRAQITDAQEKLAGFTEADLEPIADKDVAFIMGGKALFEGKGQEFLLSFNQPNLYFHATTFYDILRHKGVTLGKTDFLGPMRLSRN
ncbi:MAG: DUF1993 domain-containing protein [Erythrobacter sp.]